VNLLLQQLVGGQQQQQLQWGKALHLQMLVRMYVLPAARAG
jgi:hypothetical protein